MNAADLARLELAKHAFKATQAGDAEVQTGVRRARLSLGRPKPRRSWFSKGLVLVVLAVGSLAYAKPHGLAELVAQLRSREPAAASKRLASGAAPATTAPRLGDSRAGRAKPVDFRPVADAPATVPSSEGARTTSETKSEQAETTASPKTQSPTSKKTPVSVRSALGSSGAAIARPATATQPGAAPPTETVSDWGRVGQALARGDEDEALVALNGLSKSDDPRTRDKADLGRAQLLLAHGNPDQACQLARSLTHRRAGGRIERQAQLLLKSCAR